MWGMTAMTKGTSMKDKKKRAGGGGAPSTGTYPSVVGPGIDIGCMALGLNRAGNHLHASVLMRESFDAGGFLTITNAGGVPLNSIGSPEVEVADYIATAIQGETPINGGIVGGGGNPMQAGVFHTQNAPAHAGTTLVFRAENDEPNGAFGGGEFLDIQMVHNPNSVSIAAINGSPPAQITFSHSGYANAEIEFGPLSGGETIILEFKITGHSKAGNFSSAVISPPVSGSTLKVGSCYVQIVFN
tara:strand:- start:3151 stop:3879 length:729 start_codon:yes stop_codon:yes gene_type:complete